MTKIDKKYLEIENIKQIDTLPIPTLQRTKEQFLKWIEPLAKVNNWPINEIIEESKLFEKSRAIQEAQMFLKKKAENKNISYLSNWWYDSYLNYQGMNLNVGAAITWGNKDTEQWSVIERAAFIMWATSMFYLELKINPDKWAIFEGKKFNISLDQLIGMFAAFRKMEPNGDRYLINDELSTNTLLMYKNNIFSLETIVNNKVISLGKIKNSLQEIVNRTQEYKKINANILSVSNDRHTDSKILDELIKANPAQYNLLKKAILVVNLDHKEYKNKHEVIEKCFLNNGDINKWLGKPLNITVNNTYHSPIIMEHTYFDGASFLHVLNYFDEEILKADFKNNDLAVWQELNFKINEQQTKRLEKVLDEFNQEIQAIAFSSIEVNFGSQKLRNIGVKSVDAFFQLCGQLAQQKTFGTYYSTYEAVDMRKYHKGRTECVRPLSNSILNFADAYFKGSIDNIWNLFQDVENEHYEKVKDAKNGEGVQRHFLGLHMANQELGAKDKLPLVDSKYYVTLSGNKMSTSTIPFKTISQFAFLPVEKEGFTMGYKISTDLIFVNSTSMLHKQNKLKEYHQNLLNILNDLFEKLGQNELH